MYVYTSPPTLDLVVACPTARLLDHLERTLRNPAAPLTGQVAGEHLQLELRAARWQRFAPILNLEVRDHPAGARLVGRFDTPPETSTLLYFLSSAVAFLAFVGIMWASAQWTLGQIPTGLSLVTLASVLGTGVYVFHQHCQARCLAGREDLRTSLLRAAREAVYG